MILLSGDTHWGLDHTKILNIPKMKEKPNYLIIAGDFGLVWKPQEDWKEKQGKDFLDSQNFTTLIVPGNHENYERIYSLPKVELLGGIAYKYSEKIFFLEHGHVFTVEDKKIFVFGGAASIDKENRTDRVSWWREEIPSYEDFNRAVANLEKFNWKVDIVITHTCPSNIADEMMNRGLSILSGKFNDPTQKMLDYFEERTDCSNWYFGHWHVDKVFKTDKRYFTCLYDELESV